MRQGQLDAVVRHLRRLADAPVAEGTDAQLLQQFVACRNEEAFATLVRRHGGLIRTVCRHILHREEDVEDALQATLLVLACKAAAIRKANSVASWLYGVAYRTAMNAKKTAARRRQRERQAESRSPEQPVSEAVLRELQTILDEEVQRLPQKYRAPFVVCCLEGKSKAEAARELGWKEGTVSGRLAQARKRLQQRLSRRGVTLSAALCATGVFQDTAAAAVPAAVIRAVLSFAAGKTSAVSIPAVTLAEGVVKAMLATKLKLGAVLLLTLGVLATGVGLAAHHGFAARQAEASQPEQRRAVAERTEVAKPASRDRFGDPLPPRVLARIGTTRLRHGGQIYQLAFSPHGQTLASTGRDGMLRLWEAATGKELHRFGTVDRPAHYFAFAADGGFLVSGSGHQDVSQWDVGTGTQLRSLKNPGYWFQRVAVSPNNKLIAAAGDRHRIPLWDAGTGQVLRTLNGKEDSTFPPAIAFSPDSKTLAAAKTDRTIPLWDVATGIELRRFSVPLGPGEKPSAKPNNPIWDLAFSPDGKVLACCGTFRDIWLGDVSTGKEICRLAGGPFGTRQLAFSPDGKMLACSSHGGCFRLWDTATFQMLREFQTGGDAGNGVAFAPDSRTLATSVGPAIRLWHVQSGREILPDRGHTAELNSCMLLPDQRTLRTGTADGTVRSWDRATGQELHRIGGLPPSNKGMVLSPDGTLAVVFKYESVGQNLSESGIRLWDLAAHKERALLWRPNMQEAFFSPDGKVLLTKSWDIKESAGIIRSWDAATGKELRDVARHSNSFEYAALSPDGKVVAAKPLDQKVIRLWDTATGKELCQVPADSLFQQCFALSPDSKLLAVADGWRSINSDLRHRHIHLWEMATGKKLRQFGQSDGGYSHNGYQAIRFSPDGRTLATAGDGNCVRLWEVTTGSESTLR